MSDLQKKDGGSAFPVPARKDDKFSGHAYAEFYPASPGMSLRDYFAGQILVGFWNDRQIGFYSADDRAKLAQSSYEFADALLAERAKSTP